MGEIQCWSFQIYNFFLILKVNKSQKVVFISFYLHCIILFLNVWPLSASNLPSAKDFFFFIFDSVCTKVKYEKKWMKKHECILSQNKIQYHTIIHARSFKYFELKNWRVAKTPLVPNLLALWLRSPEPYLESLYAKQYLFVQTVAAGHVRRSTLRPGDGFKLGRDKEHNFQLKIFVQIFCFRTQWFSTS